MEGFLVLLAIAYLVSPLVLIGIVLVHRRRLRSLEDDIEALWAQLRDLQSRSAGKTWQPAPSESPAEAAVHVEESKPAAPEPAVTVTPIEPSATPVAVPVEQPEPEQPVVEPVAPVAGTQAARAGTQKRERVAAGPDWSLKVREFLRNIGMWPPQAEEGRTRETVIMQWWLPRIGGLLALLSALFFGVYINQSTSPVFKCMELAAVAAGLTGLGKFLERKYRGLGGVILVTGMIMLYLTSVSAYVLPATRIIENPVVGALAQAVVLAGICLSGYFRRSPGIVLMVFHFGFFTAVFMAWEGLREGALLAGGLLFVAGALLGRKSIFRNIPWVLFPGTFLVVLAFPLLHVLREVPLPASLPVQVYLNGALAGVMALFFSGALEGGRRARILLSIGTSLAIFSVFAYYRIILPGELEWPVLFLGLTMTAGAAWAWIRRGSDFSMQLLFIKAVFLIGTWAILHYSGDLRWMILALEAVVVAVSARRARVVALELAVWAVAGVSFVFFQDSLMREVPAALSFVWWMTALYPAVLIGAFSLLLPAMEPRLPSIRESSRCWLYVFVPLAGIGVWLYLFGKTTGRSFELALPFLVVMYGFAALSLIPILSRWLLLLTSVLGFIAASILYCAAPYSLILLLFLVAAGVTGVIRLTGQDSPAARLGENAIYVLVRVPALLWLLQVMDNWPGQALVMSIVSAMLLGSGLIQRFRDTSAWFFLPQLVFFLSESPDPQAGIWGTAGLVSALLVLAVPVLYKPVQDNLGWACRGQAWSYIGAALLWLYAVKFGDREAPWLAGQVLFSIMAYLFLAGAWRYKVGGYFIGSLLFVAMVVARHFLSMGGGASPYHPWASEALLSAALIYGYSLLMFCLMPQPFPITWPQGLRQFRIVCSGGAAILLFLNSVMTFPYTELGLMNWYTPLLALTAFVMIILGLLWSDAVFRYLGLAALAVPLARLFIVDVKDVLHRIIAFAAAAVVLTLLGYLYHRLSERLKTRE